MTESGDFRHLEHTLARLGRELDEARLTLAALRDAEARGQPLAVDGTAPQHAPTQVTPPPINERRPEPRVPAPLAARVATSNPLERLIGRYGALSLAVITIVMGAGALVSWALRQGLLTPVVRVALGALLAAAFAVAGLVIRARDNRPFGHTLLALAVAVVHVVAWGAGPQLGLVPTWASLAIADVASVALSLLALRDDSEQLFAVGVGGALLAPFVQRSGVDHFVMLAAYGLVVSTMALRTMAARAWRLVAMLVVLAAFAYAQVLVGYRGDLAWLNRDLAQLFMLILVASALVLTQRPLRPWIALALVATMAVTGGAHATQGGTPLAMLSSAPDLMLLAVAGAALALYGARELPRAGTLFWTGGALAVPLLFLLRAMLALVPTRGADLGGAVHAAVAGLWMVGYAAAALGEQGERRGVLLTVSGVVATWAAVLLVQQWPDAIPPACAGVAIAAAWVTRREGQPVIAAAAAVAAVVGFWHGFLRLSEAIGFGVPFTSASSASLALFVAGLVIAARLMPDVTTTVIERRLRLPVVAQVMVAVACFVWWRAELGHAFSADAATFLLIVYYAVCGVVVLWRGRVLASGHLRQTGLGLSVWAAVVAIAEAFTVQHIALRVGSYLGVGAFLLGVAWWYRADAGPDAGPPPGGG